MEQQAEEVELAAPRAAASPAVLLGISLLGGLGGWGLGAGGWVEGWVVSWV